MFCHSKIVKVTNSFKGLSIVLVNDIAVSVMVNKNPKSVNSAIFGVPFNSLGDFEVETYDEKDCPLCKQGVPINTQLGHGKKFLESKNKK